VALSDEEQRLLEQMEAALAADKAVLEKYLGVADSDRLKRGRARH
jgi:hypothetical protein